MMINEFVRSSDMILVSRDSPERAPTVLLPALSGWPAGVAALPLDALLLPPPPPVL